jgi:predicted peptidase
MSLKSLFLVLALVLCSIVQPLIAQPKELKYSIADPKAKANVQSVYHKGLAYNYLVYYPDDYFTDTTKTYPFLLFLHGRSLTGNNLEMIKSYGVIYEAIRGRKLPFVVVAPQSRGGGWDSHKLMDLVRYAQSKYRVDSCRTYVTGMSMGGYGAWHLAGDYPDKFAAVAPVCGGGNPKHASNLVNVPTWVFHGSKDRAVPISESTKMVDAILAKNGNKIKFTVYKQYGHSELAHVYNLDELYDWFLKFELP